MILFSIDHFRRKFFWPQIAVIVFFVCVLFYPVPATLGSYASSGSLTSAVFDTTVAGGVNFNYIMWQGSQPSGTSVSFQIATSNNSNGPWNYLGPAGTNASSDVYQPSGPAVPSALKQIYNYGKRYVRYQIFLSTNSTSATPVVTSVIIGWSY